MNMNCPFPHDMRGGWTYTDVQYKEGVRINKTTLQFKNFGLFICMERSFISDNLYKTVTLFGNGW